MYPSRYLINRIKLLFFKILFLRDIPLFLLAQKLKANGDNDIMATNALQTLQKVLLCFTICKNYYKFIYPKNKLLQFVKIH